MLLIFLFLLLLLFPTISLWGFQSLGLTPSIIFPSREKSGILNGGTCGTLECVELMELNPWKFFNRWDRWSPWSQRIRGTRGAHGRLPVVLLNVPLWIILFLLFCSRSSFYLVFLQLFSLHLVSLYPGSHRFVALRIVPHYPFTLFPLSLSPIFLWPKILSHHHHFILFPRIPSSYFSSFCISSFCVPAYFLPSSLHPQLQKALGLNVWKQGGTMS